MHNEVEAPTRRTMNVEFTGRAGEYFGIWLPNLLLTVVTIGFYSPWAKVRNTQYIYAHTSIDNASFAYTARPIDILKGRIIAVALLMVYLMAGQLAPALEPVFVVALFVGFPWLLVRALRYRYRNTVYRNLSFDFAGRYGKAFLEYVLLWLAMIPTAGLAYPYIRWRQSRFVVDNTRFGTTAFAFGAPAGHYYLVYLLPMVMVVIVFVVIGIMSSVLLPMLVAEANTDAEWVPELPQHIVYVLVAVNLALYLLFAVAMVYVTARLRNLIFNTASLDAHRFGSSVSVRKLLGLWCTNALVLIGTLGLAWPWVRVRMARYYAGCTTVLAAGDLNAFVGRSIEESRALGEEMGDVLDLDIGL